MILAMEEIKVMSSSPKEDGIFLFHDSLYGNIRLLKVVEHEPLRFASDKERLKYNPKNNKYYAIPEYNYRNCVGLSGKWSKNITKLNLVENKTPPTDTGIYIFYGHDTLHHKKYESSLRGNEKNANYACLFNVEKKFSNILKREILGVVEEQGRNVEKYNGVWIGPLKFILNES